LKKNKITLFIANLEGGGAERVMVTLANEFVNKGYEVDLLLVKAVGPFLQEVDNKVNVVSFDSSKTIFSLFPLISYLHKEKPRVILSTLLMTNIITVLAKYLIRAKAKVILREAITASADDQYKKMNFERIISLFRKWALKRADLIVAPSKGVSDDLIKFYKIKNERIRVIYNPVDINKCFQNALEKNTFLDAIPVTTPIILGIGRLNGQKDFETLINAFKIVRSSQNALLIILGEGNQRSKLEKVIFNHELSECVILPGFISNPYPFLKRASVYVLSSLYEGMPNTLIQAVVFQKQIVATDCPSGPFEILDGGKFGHLVEIGDVKGIASGILLGLTGQLKTLPADQVSALYESGHIADQYLDILISNS
jgi:glycosyltransferase involved in cell wall biosynthesis